MIGEKTYPLAIRSDYEYVSGLWKDVEETTVTGLPGHIVEFFHKAVESLSEKMDAFGYEDLTLEYNEQANEKKSSDTVRKWVKHLCDIGWLTTEPDPLDKRKVVVKMIKNPKINGNYRIPIFQDFFTKENLEKWVDDVQKISEAKQVLFKENFVSDTPCSINALYERWFRSDIFSEHSNAKSEVEGENKDGNTGFQQSPTFPNALTVQETLILLRSAFTKGTRQEFADLAIKCGLSKGEANQLFDQLTGKKLFYDPDGYWRWVGGS